MIYNFIPDIIRNKINKVALGQASPNTKTQTSFYEFLVNSRANFDIQNNTFNFFMPIQINMYDFDCAGWDEQCSIKVDDSTSKLYSQKYCGTQKFCPKEIYSDFDPITCTVKAGQFTEIDNIGLLQAVNVTDIYNKITQNLSQIVKQRFVYLVDEILGYGKIQRQIQIVLDENILFLDILRNQIEQVLKLNVQDVNISFEVDVKITPLYEVAKLFDMFYVDLIKNQFSPLYGMRILIHKDLTILPLTFLNDAVQKMQTFKNLPAIESIKFADKYISWEPLTIAIQRESGIMAVLIKKLKEQNFTFEQFLELQLRTVKFPEPP